MPAGDRSDGHLHEHPADRHRHRAGVARFRGRDRVDPVYCLDYLGMAVLPRAVWQLADTTGSMSWILGGTIVAVLVTLPLMWATHILMQRGGTGEPRACAA